MIHIKVEKKRDRTVVVHKLSKKEQISRMEWDIVNRGEIEGLEPVKILSSFIGTKLKFVVEDPLDLSSYLKSGITFGEFIQIVEDMIEIFQECRAHGIRMSNLETNPEYIFYNNMEKKLKMLYWPLISLENYADEKKIFQELASCYESREEDEPFKISYMKYFDTRKNFDFYHFEQNVSTLKKSWEVEKSEKEEQDLDPVEKTIPSWNDPDTIVNPHQLQLDEEDKTQRKMEPYLLRLSTGEKIMIRKNNFVLGRNEKCDYKISSDPYVSNRHAEIFMEKGRVCIVDLNSTNGVIINDGKRITAGEKVNLKHGDEIEIGNEKYTFFQ